MTLDLMDGKELEVYLGGKLSYWTLLELAKAGSYHTSALGAGYFSENKPSTRGSSN